MEKPDVFKRYSIGEKIDFERYETYIVYDNLFERNKRLTFLTQENLRKTNIKNLLNLYILFSNHNIKSMEYLFEWGRLSDNSYYFVRDARSLLKIKQHSFLIEDLKLLMLDILIALYGIHRNGRYYGKVHENSIYYCFNRYDSQRNIHYVLSALSDNMKYNEQQLALAQKWDIMSFGITILKLLSKDNSDALLNENDYSRLSEKLTEYNIDSETREILIELLDANEDVLYYIKKILSNDEMDRDPQLRAVYNGLLFSRFPKNHIGISNIKELDDPDKRLFILEGSEGAGKTELLNLQSQILRQKGHSIIRIESLSETNTRISIYNNLLNYIRNFLSDNDSKSQGSSPGFSEHHLLYGLSMLRDRTSPVLMIDDLEYAETDIYNLIGMFISSDIPVYVSHRASTDGNDLMHELVRSTGSADIKYFSLDDWNRGQIEELLRIAFPSYRKDVFEFMLSKLCSYGIDKPKDIMRILFQINTYAGLDEIETGKLLRIITGIISKNLIRKPFYSEISDIQKEILIILFLYPGGLKRLADIIPLSEEDVSGIIEPMMKEGYIYEKNGIYSVNRELISNNLILDENPRYIRKVHKKIANFLIQEAKKTKKYSPLIIAEHLFNSGNKSEAAPFYFNAAINFEKSYNFDQAIKYYNIALSVYRSFKKTLSLEKQRKIYLSLFDLYMKRGNLSNALQSLKNMQTAFSNDFEYYKRYSYYYRKKGDYKKAITYINRAAEIIAGKKDKKKRLEIQADLINILIEVGKFEKAYKLINESLAYQKDNGLLDNRGYLLNLLGIVYLQFGAYDKAEKCLIEASELEMTTKNYLVLPLIFNNLGIIYLEKGEFKRSLSYYSKGLDICLKVNDIIGISRGYHNIGVLCKNSGQLSEAEKYFMKAKIYHERSNLRYGYSKDLQQLGNLYTMKGELNRAFSLLKESMRASDRLYDKDSSAETLEYLGILYFFLGSYQESIQSLKEGKEKAMKTRNMNLIISINTHLSLINIDLGDFESCLKHAGHALNELRKISYTKNIFLNNSLCDICAKYIDMQKNGPEVIQVQLACASDPGCNYPEDIKKSIEAETLPISKFRLAKIYLDYFLSIHYLREETGKLDKTLSGRILDTILYLSDIMKDLNITKNSRYYDLYYRFYDCLIQADIKKDESFIANLLKKSIESLDTCINKDYSELIWRWEFLTGLCYHLFSNREKAKEHFRNTCSRLESTGESLPEPYNEYYLKVPFRKAVYNRSKSYCR